MGLIVFDSTMATGVTDFIKIDEVRQEIDSVYPNPGSDVKGDLVVANNGYSHKLVGSAFEFLCKVWLYRKCNEAICPGRHKSWELNDNDDGKWIRFAKESRIPEISVTIFEGMKWEEYEEGPSNEKEWEEMNEQRPDWDYRSPVQWAYDEDLSKIVNQFVETGMNAEGVVKAALLDAGWKSEEDLQSWINRGAFEEDLLTEMENLFELLREQDWADGDRLFDNPGFGKHRYILAGEGDLLIDDLLVDVKTTENPSFTNSFWRQLLLYYLLNDVQRELYDEENVRSGREPFKGKYPEISRVGVYFARYGELKTVDLDDVIEDTDIYEEFRAWIVDQGIEENRHAQMNYSAIRNTLTEPYDYQRQQTLFDF